MVVTVVLVLVLVFVFVMALVVVVGAPWRRDDIIVGYLRGEKVHRTLSLRLCG